MPLFDSLAFGGEKNAVVLDIGAAYTKCGFAGENGPRCIVASEVRRPKTGEVVLLRDYMDKDELHGVLVDFVHVMYFRHLLVNPKERRVVIVESVLCPSHFRNTLGKVLFQHFEVPSVLFAPSHLVTLMTLGIPSGLVIDAGYSETFLLPIYEGIPVLKAWQAIPLGGKAIHRQLEKVLMETGKVKTVEKDGQSLSEIVESIDESILEDIKVRCCFVTNLSRAQSIQAARTKEGDQSNQIPDPPPGVDYPLDGAKILHIDGKVREHTCEILFEQDSEEVSVATLILDALLKCPVDCRKALAENIVLIGGTAMLTGFKHRLMTEVKDLLNRPQYAGRLAFKEIKLHSLPAKENYAAWLGGSIFGALEVLGSRSLAKDAYLQNKTIPDWSTIQDLVEIVDDKPINQKR